MFDGKQLKISSSTNCNRTLRYSIKIKYALLDKDVSLFEAVARSTCENCGSHSGDPKSILSLKHA
jgi:hypothetical protein